MISKENIIKILVLLLLFAPLFFYKLGQTSLISWDEAWYADVSRNIINTGDLFNLSWNGMPFSDKPPGGFWLEAISFKILGVSEFSARLPSAVAGVLSLYLIYLLGNKLFNKLTGILSISALVSSPWFLYRSRVGDLDSLLTFFYLLTLYLAYLARENKKFLIPFCLSLAYLPMIKGVVFVGAVIPSLLIIFWGNKIYKIKDYLLALFLSFGFFGTWILVQYLNSPDLVRYHFSHSLRESSFESNILSNFQVLKEYLHSGIGRWFWPGILGVVAGMLLKNKRIFALSIFFFFYSLQFLLSPKIEIWHLIPLYPFMILCFFSSVQIISTKIIKKKILASILISIFTFYISFNQIKNMWHQFIDIPAFVSDEAILSREASKYPYPFYIDSSFEPAAVFYSGKEAKWVNEYYLPDLFKKSEPFVMIIKEPMLDKLGVLPKDYQVLKRDRDKSLILYQPG